MKTHITSMISYGSVQVGMGVIHFHFRVSTVSLLGVDLCVEIPLRARRIIGYMTQL